MKEAERIGGDDSPLTQEILEAVAAPDSRQRCDDLAAHYGLAMLPLLRRLLAPDQSLEEVERLEVGVKATLRRVLGSQMDGNTARELARHQQEIGLLLKYKSYTVKAASPLGYSIFLQSPGQGFSFQQHTSHKVEVFHILDVSPGGFVFLCDYSEWHEVYEPKAFEAWLSGGPDERYERFRHIPRPGDVIAVDRLGVVHSVFGCRLEEFATVSTDMVDRLHDQNADRPIPPHFSRAYAKKALQDLPDTTDARRVWRTADGWQDEPMTWSVRPTCRRLVITQGIVEAARIMVDARSSTDWFQDPSRAACVYVLRGSGSITLADSHEVRQKPPPSLSVAQGDLLLIAPGIHYQVRSDPGGQLTLSEHRIPPSVALV